MIDLKIKITGLSVYDEQTPLELSLEDARELHKALVELFKDSMSFVPFSPVVLENK